jgi:hypothetical protein
MILSKWLTRESSVLSDKLTVFNLVKNCPAFYTDLKIHYCACSSLWRKITPCVYHVTTISNKTVCRIKMKFGIGLLYRILLASVSFQHIRSANVRLVSGRHIISIHRSYLWTDFGEIRYRKSCNAIERMWCSWESQQWRQHFAAWRHYISNHSLYFHILVKCADGDDT